MTETRNETNMNIGNKILGIALQLLPLLLWASAVFGAGPSISYIWHDGAWVTATQKVKIKWVTTSGTSATLTDPTGATISVPLNGSIDVSQYSDSYSWKLTVKDDNGWTAIGIDGVHGKLTAAQINPTLALTPEQIKSAALGPTFDQLNPGAVDTRPTLFTAPDRSATLAIGNRCDPYQIAAVSGQRSDTDYWSESGQVETVSNVYRVQFDAYTNHSFAIRPKFDQSANTDGTEPYLSLYYINSVKTAAGTPIASVRNEASLCNEALGVFSSGIVGPMGTQTSRDGWVFGITQLPATKVPTAISLSSGNEFAFVTVTDTVTGNGQIAVIACEGKYLAAGGHTWTYIALPNQGSWSDLKIVGYIDLPIKAPTAIATASNGFWDGTSSTNNQDLGQIPITDPGTRWGLRQGDYGWQKIVASKGYALVASKTENKVVVVDLAPLFAYFKDAWLSDTQQPITIAARAAGTFPPVLTAVNLGSVVASLDIPKPTAVLAGHKVDRWSADFYKGYVAQESGLLSILDTSTFMTRWPFEQTHAFGVIGTLQVGRNPVSMSFAEFHPWRYLTLNALRLQGDGSYSPTDDPLNNLFYVASRGDRRIDGVETLGGNARVWITLQDKRMSDPVMVTVSKRNNLVHVADFAGHKVSTFRMFELEDRQDPWQNPKPPRVLWGCGTGSNGSTDAEYYEQPLPDAPFAVNCANVN